MRRETIGVIQNPGTDRNGNPLGSAPADVPLPGCIIWPRAAEERDGGEVSVDGENVAAPDNAIARTIGYEDWVRIRGEIHQVDEPPARFAGKKIMLKTKRVRTGGAT